MLFWGGRWGYSGFVGGGVVCVGETWQGAV